MKRAQLKSLLIVVLIIASLFQTGKLWLNKSLSRDFFYMLFSRQTASTSYGDVIQNTPLFPGAVNINFGNEKFERLLIDAKDTNNAFVESVTDILAEGLTNGVFIGEEPLDYEELLSYRSVMYEYGMEMNAFDFFNHMQVKNNGLAQQIGSFDTIFIIPSRTVSGELTIHFVNAGTQKAKKVFLRNYTENNEKILNGISAYQRERSIFYIATTQQKQFDSIFYQNVFVPQWTDFPLVYDNAPIQKEYYLLEDRQEIYRFISPFISTNSIQWERMVKPDYIFSNETTVVTIYENGLLQYENYSQAGADLLGYSLLDSYAVARNFLAQDIYLEESLYLAEVEQTENQYIFYFDYYWGQFPICLSENLKQSLGIDHSVVVVVENDAVVLFKKYMVSFSKEDSRQQTIDMDFITALNQLFYRQPMENVLVNRMFLGYALDGKNRLDLSWFIEINGAVYEEPATEDNANGYE